MDLVNDVCLDLVTPAIGQGVISIPEIFNIIKSSNMTASIIFYYLSLNNTDKTNGPSDILMYIFGMIYCCNSCSYYLFYSLSYSCCIKLCY